MARHVVDREVGDDDLHAVHASFQKRRDLHRERWTPHCPGPLVIHIDNSCLAYRRPQPRLHSAAKIKRCDRLAFSEIQLYGKAGLDHALRDLETFLIRREAGKIARVTVFSPGMQMVHCPWLYSLSKRDLPLLA